MVLTLRHSINMSLRWAVWLLDPCIHASMIADVRSINTSVPSQKQDFCMCLCKYM